MFYQSILMESSPYHVRFGEFFGFAEHRHADIEINFCLDGCFDAVLDKRRLTVEAGELLLITPMAAHMFSLPEEHHATVLTIVIGASFLKNFFSSFTSLQTQKLALSPDSTLPTDRELYALLTETAALYRQKSEIAELAIRGNLYKICASLLQIMTEHRDKPRLDSMEMKQVAAIDAALDMIYYRYGEPLTLEDAATATGYGKSNFCKIFKSITGDTFHNTLNRHRVDTACTLLHETELPISQIASSVGFAEAKTFCRIFKSITALTPGQYRKKRQ